MIAQLDRNMLYQAPGRTLARLGSYFLFEGRPLTTRGQWWNPVAFSNLRVGSRSGLRPARDPVFVIGMGRSGTTLLGRLLAIHPEVGFLNEPKALWHVVRGDEDVIGSYGHPGTGRMILGAEDATPDVIARAHGMYGWFARITRTSQIVDKYPELVFRRALARKIFPDSKFLIATRAPGPALDSVARWSQVHGDDQADWWGLNDQKWRIIWEQVVEALPEHEDLKSLDLAGCADHKIRAGVEWTVTTRASIAAARDQRSLIVSYDRLIDSPVQEMKRVLRFCGLKPSAGAERYAAQTVGRPVHEATSLGELPDSLTEIILGTQSDLASIGGCPPANHR